MKTAPGMRMRRSTKLVLATLLLGSAAACAVGTSKNGAPSSDVPTDDGLGGPTTPPPRPPDVINDDAGAFNLGNRGKDSGTTHPPDASPPRDNGDAAPPVADASPPPPPEDASPPPPPEDASPPPPADSGTVSPPVNACPAPLAAGDLAVVEIMIASQSAAGDRGEWFEIQSTRACSVNLNGLHVAVTSSGATLDVTSDLWLPPNGIVVVADASDAATNHHLPGALLVLAGQPSDVLANAGDTITLSTAGATVDAITYPAFVLYAGESITFPADCAWSDRASWARWSYAAHTWFSPYQGTPNADNTDVTCY